jgi:hypothetical protein
MGALWSPIPVAHFHGPQSGLSTPTPRELSSSRLRFRSTTLYYFMDHDNTRPDRKRAWPISVAKVETHLPKVPTSIESELVGQPFGPKRRHKRPPLKFYIPEGHQPLLPTLTILLPPSLYHNKSAMPAEDLLIGLPIRPQHREPAITL